MGHMKTNKYFTKYKNAFFKQITKWLHSAIEDSVQTVEEATKKKVSDGLFRSYGESTDGIYEENFLETWNL